MEQEDTMSLTAKDVQEIQDKMPLPTHEPLTVHDREFLLGRALLVILGINVVWAVVMMVIVWAFVTN